MLVDCVSPAMQKIDALIERIAPTDLNVLITGQSGVGKEVVARKIFNKSLRREQPFITIHASEISLGTARQGTVFFDEIAELTADMQIKLLQMIRNRVEVRILAATNQDLTHKVEAGAFRRDLFYRLNVIHIRVPLLRGTEG